MTPCHPGETVREYMEHRQWTMRELARRAKVPVSTISQLILGRRSITANMALTLEEVFERPAQWWMNLQVQYWLYLAREKRVRSKKR